jgi:Xaa-Pro aminopeptidase
MFQSFETFAEPARAPERAKRVRALMAEAGVDALLVPRADEHQGEYVPASAERLKWLTGFTGSAGLAVLTRRAAALFVDGRYTVQARAEADTELFELPDLPRGRVAEWIAAKLAKGGTVGFDPWLHTGGEIDRLGEALRPKGIELKPLARNLVDRAWGRERPAPPIAPLVVHPAEYAGRSAADKIADLQAKLGKDGQDAVVLTLPDSICWLFNIRGADVPHNPVALAFALVPAKGKPELVIAPEKLTPEVRAHLAPVARLSPPAALKERIAALREAKKRVRLDPETAAHWFVRALGGKERVLRGADPCLALKARKNAAEIAGARAAHLRDGAAMVRFLAWLDREAPSGTVDEISAVKRLEAFRRETNALREISFDTIAGSGPHGAIVHYRVTETTNRTLQPGELFLVDSGGQYADGTTDITRTVAIGEPTPEMRERFTLVLKGHIAIATARFPRGVRGIDLDPLARAALWAHGLDYDHGTGHGVGSYLSVHEGPQSISKSGMVALEPGMICSNEPGYYKAGAYGIRIENLVLVREPETLPGADRQTLSFETLTLCPIDRGLVVPAMLSPAERDWLDAYHARVRDSLAPLVDEETRAWLAQATAKL